MSYIGIAPSTAAFPFDQFSGNGTTTAFTMSYAPASTTSMVVCISGVVQNPNTYSITGLTLTFSAAPPTGTNNIGVLYLGIPATSVTTPGNTAYLTTTSFTATAGQTTFTPSATYQVGYINVIRNGSQLAPADFTATNGTTVVLANPCVAGDTVVTQGYTLASLVNALPLTGGTVTGATTFSGTTAFSGTNTFSGASTFTNQVTINGGSASGYTGYKNRIINGEMDIDQRNNGASVTPSNTYTLDRWAAYNSQASKYTVQQNAGSVTPPAGFTKYLGVTSSSAYSVLTGDYFFLNQAIEGLNIADLAWGTASAATVTLSFQVRSSLTGTFGGALKNGGSTRSYPFTYSIPVANTWTTISVTIVGDTTGTWATDNTSGLNVQFGLGAGTTFSGTAGAWATANFVSATGAVSVVGTSGATFYVTGVQLERGSNATSFEFRDYGRELVMCQRYYQRYSGIGLTFYGYWDATNAAVTGFNYPVTPRVAPTSINVSSVSHFSINNSAVGNPVAASITLGNSTTSTFELYSTVASGGSSSGKACKLYSTSASAFIELAGTEL
jgi:hypothetical protein